MLVNGYQLHAARMLAGLKQSELGEMSGMSGITIANLEKKREASLSGSAASTLTNIERALNAQGVVLVDTPEGVGAIRRFA
jgi:transcriptional regulator with XRE-family HTH domain